MLKAFDKGNKKNSFVLKYNNVIKYLKVTISQGIT